MARALCDTGGLTVHRILVRECSGPGRPVWPLEQRMRSQRRSPRAQATSGRAALGLGAAPRSPAAPLLSTGQLTLLSTGLLSFFLLMNRGEKK
eukprot:scaffold6529_cov121-Isochrysis_galbana.AAC.1